MSASPGGPSSVRGIHLGVTMRRTPVAGSIPVALAATLGCAIALAGCQQEDTGNCCLAISADAASAIPSPQPRDGGLPRNLVGEHPAFDCDNLACVSWQGADAFCSKRCDEDSECGDGFVCRPVLESSPGAGASIQPDDKFCVRMNCASDGDCPEDMKCTLVHKGTGAPDVDIRQCLRPDQACAQ